MIITGIMSFFNALVQNPIIVMSLMILTPVGIILAIVFYFKSKKNKSLIYYIKSDLLIEDFIQKIKGLTIQFTGKTIERLTVTKIAFWNNGNDTINQSDFPSTDKFSIQINNDYDILDVSITTILNITNNIIVDLSENKKEINIDFEYMDKNDGFIIQIFHTGINSDIFTINGTIKGAGKIHKNKNPKILTAKRVSEIIFDSIVFLTTIIMSIKIISTIDSAETRKTLIPIIIIISFIYLGKILLYYSRAPSELIKKFNS